MRLFLNPDERAYLRELSGEFGISPSLVSGELKQLEASKLVKSERNGRHVFFRANRRHALFPELQSMVRKALGMDRILDSIIERLGNVEQAILIDDYAAGKDTGLIDLVLVGDINHENLADLVAKTERYIERKIRPLTVRREEAHKLDEILGGRSRLVLWERPGTRKSR
jgi:DNA-binding transcriptional ArsR family regulator